MDNQITINLTLPTNLEDKEAVGAFMAQQTVFLARTWKDILTNYREQGIEVPSISVRGLSKKKESNEELKTFRKVLLDHLLSLQPKAIVAPQMQVITELFTLGHPAEYWIEKFEDFRLGKFNGSAFPLTTWRTVKWSLGKESNKEAEVGIQELSSDKVSDIQERIKSYGNQ